MSACEGCGAPLPLRRMYTSSSDSYAELYPPSPPPPSCFICAAGIRIQAHDADGQAKKATMVCVPQGHGTRPQAGVRRVAVTFFTSLVSLLRSSSMMTSESVICCSVGASACTLSPLATYTQPSPNAKSQPRDAASVTHNTRCTRYASEQRARSLRRSSCQRLSGG